MQKTALSFTTSSKTSLKKTPTGSASPAAPALSVADPNLSVADPNLSLADLAKYAEGWLLDCEIRQHSPQTRSFRRLMLDKLLWFLREKGFTSCGKAELRAFLAYLTTGHAADGGRWGNAQLTQAVRPSTSKTYHAHLRTFFRWLVADEVLTASPMETLAAPVARPDQIQPFTDDQLKQLRSAAKRSRHPKRDEAIVLFLLDTGVRASELCSLRYGDLDMSGRSCRVVHGKGNKSRSVPLGAQCLKCLYNYLREDTREKDAPLFQSDRGSGTGEALTRSGLGQLVERLGLAAGIEQARCSPHTFRHTFAVNALRNGCDAFTLQEMLGHTNLQMTNRYVALAQADIARKHRQFSPVDRMWGKST